MIKKKIKTVLSFIFVASLLLVSCAKTKNFNVKDDKDGSNFEITDTNYTKITFDGKGCYSYTGSLKNLSDNKYKSIYLKVIFRDKKGQELSNNSEWSEIYFYNVEPGQIMQFDFKILDTKDLQKGKETFQMKWEIDNGTQSVDFVIPDSDKRLITFDEIQYFDDFLSRIAINEIYARHGRRFKDQALQEYFDSKTWYNGNIGSYYFDESVLSDIEFKNIDLLVKFREIHGYR